MLRLVSRRNLIPPVHFAERSTAALAAEVAAPTGEIDRAEVYLVPHKSIAKAIDAVMRGEGELVEVRHAPKP